MKKVLSQRESYLRAARKLACRWAEVRLVCAFVQKSDAVRTHVLTSPLFCAFWHTGSALVICIASDKLHCTPFIVKSAGMEPMHDNALHFSTCEPLSVTARQGQCKVVQQTL